MTVSPTKSLRFIGVWDADTLYDALGFGRTWNGWATPIVTREVLVQVAGGHSNDEIAERLEVSPLTAKTHVNRAMAKLRARDRAQLVVFAYESGLVAPPRG